MRIYCTDVRSVAEAGILASSYQGIHSHDLAGIASCFQQVPCGAQGGHNSSSIGRARIDQLVPDGDGIEVAPIAVCGGGNKPNLLAQGVDVIDASEELEAMGLGSGQDGLDLIAVGPVDTHHGVARADGAQICVDLIL